MFDSWIDKKDIVQISEYFSKPKSSVANVKVEWGLSNYVTKADLENAAADVDTLDFTKKIVFI